MANTNKLISDLFPLSDYRQALERTLARLPQSCYEDMETVCRCILEDRESLQRIRKQNEKLVSTLDDREQTIRKLAGAFSSIVCLPALLSCSVITAVSGILVFLKLFGLL